MYRLLSRQLLVYFHRLASTVQVVYEIVEWSMVISVIKTIVERTGSSSNFLVYKHPTTCLTLQRIRLETILSVSVPHCLISQTHSLTFRTSHFVSQLIVDLLPSLVPRVVFTNALGDDALHLVHQDLRVMPTSVHQCQDVR